MNRGFAARLSGERGSAGSLLVVASLFAALAFTGAHIVPLTLRLQDTSEVDQAFMLATPHPIRAGVTDSTGRLSLLDETSLQEAAVNHLHTFRTNVLTEREQKTFCAVPVDVGSGAICPGSSQDTAQGPSLCPTGVIMNGNYAQGWRWDGSTCLVGVWGAAMGGIINSAINDSGDNAERGAWGRYYFITTRDDTMYFDSRPIDTRGVSKAVAMTSWVAPSNSGTTMTVNPFQQ